MKTHAFLLTLFLYLATGLQAADINIIPYPTKIKKDTGEFVISSNTKITCSKELRDMGSFYSETLGEMTGFSLPIVSEGKAGSVINLTVDKKAIFPEEGYSLRITPERIDIFASSSKGIFYGLQSLRQLISVGQMGKSIVLPALVMEDAPRFGWRGLMLDVSRTFIDKTLLKRYIDLMAMYKLNRLHLHMSDDQGWRVEIKRYPELTRVGSRFDSEYNEMGGYYTQDDIRELVHYASLRNVMIIPEFEMPGHECAAIASYPELSCAGIRPKIHSFLKGPSVHTEIFCGGKPEVYTFVFNVLDELMELFPSPYIHIGGDEAPKDEWKKCSYCQQAIKDNQLANEEELQSHFVKRVGEHLRSKGRILIGWDEIVDGGKLNGDEVVMYWRSWQKENLEKVASGGFKIISTPTSHCYFDYAYKDIDTRKVYNYEPVPANTSSDIISNYIGVQANFWSHIDRSESNIDKQLFPRLFALSEVAWSNPDSRDWERFKKAVIPNREWLLLYHVNSYPDESLP